MNINYELLQFYVYKKLITKKDAQQILEECNLLQASARERLFANKFVTERSELDARGEYYCIPSIEVDMLAIEKKYFKRFSYGLMKKHKIIPVMRTDDGTFVFATAKPVDCHTRSVVASQFSGKVDFILVPSIDIDRLIDSASAADTTQEAVEDINSEEGTGTNQRGEEVEIQTEGEVINNPVVRLVDSIIKEAIPARASDIHIEPFEKTVQVRYRVDGDLQERISFRSEAYPAVCARLKIISGLNIAERRSPQDGRINMTIGGKEYDFRVSTLPTVFGEKFVIRILDKTSFEFTREELGFSDEDSKVVDKMLAHPHGIILLTGPTGCGKSTTLYSFLKEVNDSKVNIVTVEDPVEFTMDGINQTQVNPKANLTFAAALRSILRQDPDIIMIGEIRDEETAEIAVRSAITGHIVFSTLHTNDAPGAILRLEDMKVDDYLVADALVGVIAQRLVKRLCTACKKRVKTTAVENKMLGIEESAWVYKPAGCQFCNNTGYKGRIGVYEIMYMNEEMKTAALENKNLEELRKKAVENGMVPLSESCKKLVLKGITSVTEFLSLNEE